MLLSTPPRPTVSLNSNSSTQSWLNNLYNYDGNADFSDISSSRSISYAPSIDERRPEADNSFHHSDYAATTFEEEDYDEGPENEDEPLQGAIHERRLEADQFFHHSDYAATTFEEEDYDEGVETEDEPLKGGYDTEDEDGERNDHGYEADDEEISDLRNDVEEMKRTIQEMSDTLKTIASAIKEGQAQRISAPEVLRKQQHSTGPRRRSAQKNMLARQIRKELEKLLGDMPFARRNVMSPLELNAFVARWNASSPRRRPVCCDIAQFKVDLVGSPKSPWNQSASRVFTVHFMQVFAHMKYSATEVQDGFFVRIKSLKASLNSLAADENRKAKRRRDQRRQGTIGHNH
ncbi:hypothetical protein JR316_0006193 [Psilocybe cubensis]|uniref:Uncharacterized protein n=1 Tax=Psilocybe cubensis TaxID=181762 RepID=A0ACB8H1F5_PSICU|nr:hypothetical protein JR316_0006193 [Psilocybe cubensis]KAH9481666.1 hypothetical protein JR316_0006193 [Psilocybe cubensis]